MTETVKVKRKSSKIWSYPFLRHQQFLDIKDGHFLLSTLVFFKTTFPSDSIFGFEVYGTKNIYQQGMNLNLHNIY